MATYLIGIDVGTSSAKAVLMNAGGDVVFTTAPEYDFETPRPGWAECNPEDWWTAVQEAIRQILEKVRPEEVAGIGLTGQMHGLVLLDGKGDVLRPCIMWNDQRTAAQCASLTELIGERRVLEITGNPILPGFTLPKIRWVQENEPEIWDQASNILLPKDYIRYRLSGEFATDVSDASGTSLLDVGARNWSKEILEKTGIPKAMMPVVTESTAASTQVNAAAARATGLLEGTPIIAGGGDQAAGAVGCGIVRSGVLSCTLGTSGVLFAHADEFKPDPEGRLHAFCAAVPGKWHFMGVQLSSAGSYQWFRKTFAPELEYDAINAEAKDVPSGSEGLLFLPYLSGERTPHPDPSARGVFFGMSLRHTRGHFARAVMEGVTYGLRDALEIMRELGLESREIVASGGGAKSPLWRQMLADVFNTRIVTVNATEGAAYGAAVLASVGAGIYETVEEACDSVLRQTGETLPGPDVRSYDAFYERYIELYPALKDSFARTAQTVEDLG